MATFCLLHGKWHGGDCWVPLTAELERHGHRCLAPDLPLDDPAATHERRARPAIEAMRGARGPLVVVGHSLAASVAPLAAEAVAAARLVYLCPAPSGPLGRAEVGVGAIRPGFPFPPDHPDGTSQWLRDDAVAAMYPRLAPDTARALAARLRPGASAPDAYPRDRPPALPAALVLALEDEFFEPEWSRRVAAVVLGERAIEMPTGHFPMVEAPADLARILDGLARTAGR